MEIEHVYRTPIAYKVAQVGVVGRDPEVKYLPNWQAVANFSITNHIDSWGFATTSSNRVQKPRPGREKGERLGR